MALSETPQNPPSQAPPYRYQPPPEPPRPGCLATITRMGGALIILLVVFLLGSQAAMFALRVGNVIVPSTYRDGTGPDSIAIIPITGVIDGYMADHIHHVVESVIADGSIKAVVLRIESPGGSASASDQILHELSRLRAERALPVIASYGGYAASGGYYVSCQADKIFAEPTTVTGSIGVIAQAPTFQVLLEEKLGVKVEVITATGSPEKETGNTYYRTWTDKDRAAIRKLVDAMHARFVEVVAQGRVKVLTPERIAELANGEAYTAIEARDHKLIDEIGYLDAALTEATLAGTFTTDKPPVVTFHTPTGFFDLFGFQGRTRPVGGVDFSQTLDAATVQRWIKQSAVPEIVMMMNP